MKPSWVTIGLVLIGGALTIAAMFYDTKADVKVNAAEIKHNTEDIETLETKLDRLPDRVAEKVIKEMRR